MLMEHHTSKPELILKLLQFITRNYLINCKTYVSTEKWNSRAEFYGKNDQPRKNLDKLTVYFLLYRIS